MTTITEFLLARIAEDEAAAHDRRLDDSDALSLATSGFDVLVTRDESLVLTVSPERVLVECKAKRTIAELHGGDHECSTYDHHGEVDNCTWVLGGDCSTLRLLAAVYADHPDYQAEWKP